MKQYGDHERIELLDKTKSLKHHSMDVMRVLRANRSEYYLLSATGHEMIAMVERVVANLHKWVYVEQVFNEKLGVNQVSVIMSRSHDFH